jgi:hypothetical protein
MKKLIIATLFFLVVLVPVSAHAYEFAEDWTKTDTAYQTTFIAIATVDWMQTRWMAQHDWQWDGKYYRETNPFLGDFPSESKVNTLVPLGILAHTLVAMAIPPRSCTEEQEKNGHININFRRIWQLLFIGVESAAVYKNYSIGVKLEF